MDCVAGIFGFWNCLWDTYNGRRNLNLVTGIINIYNVYLERVSFLYNLQSLFVCVFIFWFYYIIIIIIINSVKKPRIIITLSIGCSDRTIWFYKYPNSFYPRLYKYSIVLWYSWSNKSAVIFWRISLMLFRAMSTVRSTASSGSQVLFYFQ